MYDVCLTKMGVIPMTSRLDLIKIIGVAALVGILFYYLAHRGL